MYIIEKNLNVSVLKERLIKQPSSSSKKAESLLHWQNYFQIRPENFLRLQCLEWCGRKYLRLPRTLYPSCSWWTPGQGWVQRMCCMKFSNDKATVKQYWKLGWKMARGSGVEGLVAKKRYFNQEITTIVFTFKGIWYLKGFHLATYIFRILINKMSRIPNENLLNVSYLLLK